MCIGVRTSQHHRLTGRHHLVTSSQNSILNNTSSSSSNSSRSRSSGHKHTITSVCRDRSVSNVIKSSPSRTSPTTMIMTVRHRRSQRHSRRGFILSRTATSVSSHVASISNQSIRSSPSQTSNPTTTMTTSLTSRTRRTTSCCVQRLMPLDSSDTITIVYK